MRASGILLPIFSLPGKYGIGSFSKEAYRFADWLKAAGQKYWQILPLGPTGCDASPYQAYCTFAGDPNLIDMETLYEEGLLTREELAATEIPYADNYVDYDAVRAKKWPALQIAFDRFEVTPEFEAYCEENADWLKDYTVYKTLKSINNQEPWYKWEKPYRNRHKKALEKIEAECAEQIRFYKFVEYIFHKQWSALKSYANEKGIEIIGDLPIYVSMDSSDAWASPKLFKMDRDLKPKAVAGCPPDYFAEDGQLWGNPVYDWKYHEKTDFEWWMKRFRHCFEIYDVLRLDHFRGFSTYYEIPYGAENAREGKWVKGPGMKLFNRLNEVVPDAPVIAEDLGLLTPDVFELLKASGYPGMKVLAFAFDDSCDSLYLPHKYEKNCVVYTGTHDNDTVVGWLEKVGSREKKFICDYVGHWNCSNKDIAFEVVRLAMGSTARLAIIPMQDYLGLGNEARINVPGTVGNNWRWRMDPQAASTELAAKIEWLTELFGRKNREQ